MAQREEENPEICTLNKFKKKKKEKLMVNTLPSAHQSTALLWPLD